MADSLASSIAQRLEAMGGCTQAQAQLLAESACTQIDARLQPGVSPESIGNAYVTAATLWAMGLQAAAAVTEVQMYAAGDVRVQRRSAADAMAGAKALQQQARSILSGFLADDGFAFRGVDG